MFRTVPLSINRSSSLYTRQWYMSYRFADSLRAGSGWKVPILLASCGYALSPHRVAQQNTDTAADVVLATLQDNRGVPTARNRPLNTNDCLLNYKRSICSLLCFTHSRFRIVNRLNAEAEITYRIYGWQFSQTHSV